LSVDACRSNPGQPADSKQIIVMRRDANGGWLVQAVIFNAAG
jgi:hypothetical protein